MNTRRGFTVVELLVVIGIIVLVVAISVPAFSSLKYSTDRSLAINSVRASVSLARDLSTSSGRGGDGALAVLFEPGGTMRLVPCVAVGTLQDLAPPGGGGQGPGGNRPGLFIPGRAARDVFVPVETASVSALPAFWSVRGFAEPGSRGGGWYASGLTAADTAEGAWIFPESGFYDSARQAGSDTDPDAPRQSFMIRFDADTGAVVTDRTQGLLVDPRPSAADRVSDDPTSPRAWTRADKAANLERWALRVLNDPDPNGDGQPYGGQARADPEGDTDSVERSRLIGNRAHDTVLLQPVSRLAVYDERRLAAGIGARGLNAQTRSLYLPHTGGDRPGARLDESLFPPNGRDPALIRDNIASWIVGDTAGGTGTRIGDGRLNFDEGDASPEEVDQPEAKLFSVSPYTGELTEVDR